MTINKWITSQIIGELDNVETGSPKTQDNLRNMEWSVGSGWDGGRLRKAVRTLTVGDDIDLSLLAAGMHCSYG